MTGSAQPGLEDALRLVVIADDVRELVRPISIPTGYLGAQRNPIAGLVGCVEIAAGSRGMKIKKMWTTQTDIGRWAIVDLTLITANLGAQAWGSEINGDMLSVVSTGTRAAGLAQGNPFMTNLTPVMEDVWIPPGKIFSLVGDVVNVVTLLNVIANEPGVPSGQLP